MRTTISTWAIVLCTMMLIVGCCYTDVPVSSSKKLTDARLVGYWQSKSDAYKIVKNKDGSCVIYSYQYMAKDKTYKQEGGSMPAYFTSITDNEGTEQFLSYGKEKKFFTVKYNFASDNEITVYPLSEDYLKEHFKSDDDVVRFETTGKFQAFLKSKLHEEDLYDVSSSYDKTTAP